MLNLLQNGKFDIKGSIRLQIPTRLAKVWNDFKRSVGRIRRATKRSFQFDWAMGAS